MRKNNNNKKEYMEELIVISCLLTLLYFTIFAALTVSYAVFFHTNCKNLYIHPYLLSIVISIPLGIFTAFKIKK